MKMSSAHTALKKELDLLFEENRLATFKSWTFSDDNPCNKLKMAEAGFIFIGNKSEPDAVKCFLCDKSLDGWAPEDNPWSEHLLHSPNCFFAKLRKPEYIQTPLEFLDIKDELCKKIIKRFYDSNKEVVNQEFNSIVKVLNDL